jgi:hypothetical protein
MRGALGAFEKLFQTAVQHRRRASPPRFDPLREQPIAAWSQPFIDCFPTRRLAEVALKNPKLTGF